ncbi:MAG: FxsA family protein [Gammaproteobacteria bacterium]|nr:FxsA family protein [Gammaproteobacteria bacterium]
MPILPFILLFFIVIPLLEIYLLIEVGGVVGAFPTVIAVVFTAVLGVTLIRIQGFSTIQKAQMSMRQGIVPATEMFEGIMLLFAAICLLIPGFFTDALGFLLLIPPLRMFLARRLIGSAMLKTRFQTSRSDFFEGEYEDLTPEQQHQRAQNRLHHRDIIEGRVESDDDRK